jgi:hypothetical protein
MTVPSGRGGVDKEGMSPKARLGALELASEQVPSLGSRRQHERK